MKDQGVDGSSAWATDEVTGVEPDWSLTRYLMTGELRVPLAIAINSADYIILISKGFGWRRSSKEAGRTPSSRSTESLKALAIAATRAVSGCRQAGLLSATKTMKVAQSISGPL